MLSLTACMSKNKKIPWRVVEEEAILVDVSGACIIHLDEVGAEIWNAIDGKRSIADIIQHIRDVFDTDGETAQKDTLEFIEQLLRKGLIEDVS